MLVLDLLHVELIHFVSAAGDASQMLERNAERTDISSGLVSSSDCCLIISAPIDRGNADLALSISLPCAPSLIQVSISSGFVQKKAAFWVGAIKFSV